MRGSPDVFVEEDVVNSSPFSNLGPKTRKLVAFLLPAMVFHFGYWSIMIYRGLLYVFIDKYPMSITMIVGSLMAGKINIKIYILLQLYFLFSY